MGYDCVTKSEIRSYLSEHEIELSDMQRKKIEDYLEFGNNLDGTKCVITTHAMFLGLDETILNKYEIIVDEDLLMSIFKGTETISFECLKACQKLDILSDESRRSINKILNTTDKEFINISIQQLWDGQISKIFSDKENFQKYGALPRFLRSKCFFIDREKELVYYFDGLKIPKVKMTIVSATLNEKLYKDYLKALGDNREIYLYEIPEAKYKGEKPVALFEQLFSYVTLEGEIVLDQYAGSGAVGVACIHTKRKCILIELLKEKVDKLKNRIVCEGIVFL